MSMLLAGLGALAIVAFVTSALIGVAWIFGASRLKMLAPAAESRLLMLLMLLPIAMTAVSLVAYWEWPGEGGVDTWSAWELFEREVVERSEHERAGNGEYPHEDTANERHEAGPGPDGRAVLACLAFVGLALIGRFLVMLSRILRAVRVSSKTSASLCEAARLHPNRAWVLPSAKPEAFVLGLLRPKLFVSQGLLDLPDDMVDSVMAHERAHIERRDPLRLLVAQLACTFHVPGVSKRLRQRAQQIQELVADAMAAKWLGDSTCVADALLRCCAVHGSAIATTPRTWRLVAATLKNVCALCCLGNGPSISLCLGSSVWWRWHSSGWRRTTRAPCTTASKISLTDR